MENQVMVPVSCPHCEQNQLVQIRARAGFSQMNDQMVECLKCKRGFDVMLPDEITGGPYLP
jgi:hypothetical protein